MTETKSVRPYSLDPFLGFYFKVSFNDSRFTSDLSFQSVSGLTAEIVTEAYKEGGQNQFDYKLPLKTQYPDLILKRGLWVSESSAEVKGLHKWFADSMQTLMVSPVDLDISLLNAKDDIVLNWNVKKAWPKKWTISDFNAEENQVVIETMEFHYNYFTIGRGVKGAQTETPSTEQKS